VLVSVALALGVGALLRLVHLVPEELGREAAVAVGGVVLRCAEGVDVLLRGVEGGLVRDDGLGREDDHGGEEVGGVVVREARGGIYVGGSKAAWRRSGRGLCATVRFSSS
jgi:hypothetical protein